MLYGMTFGFSKEIVMAVSHSGCETCAKICDDAKKNVKKLEKKIQALTIVCTVSVTIIGQQGAKALLDAIYTFNKVTEVAGGKETSKEENKDANKEEQTIKPNQNDKIGFGGWKPHRKNDKQIVQEITDPSKAFNELAKLKEEQEKQKEKQNSPQIVTDTNLTKEIVKAALNTNTELPIDSSLISMNPTIGDPYAFFLTPSALPFDVYNNTIALGNNYGFGEYYGIDSSSGYINPTPSANTLSVFVLGSFFNSRKRA